MSTRMIITGASADYGPSLLAMLGSLDANWPDHPPVRIYDIGMDDRTRAALAQHDYDTVTVPHFCSHWRKHFTWKPWAWMDAPGDQVFWLDAGLVVLRPLPEAFAAIDRHGYFAVRTGARLGLQVPAPAYGECGLAAGFAAEQLGTAGGVFGFDRASVMGDVIGELHRVSLNEDAIRATTPTHRHDQALLALLLQHHCAPVVQHDTATYIGWLNCRQAPSQAIWVHRKTMHPHDLGAFAQRIGHFGHTYLPQHAPVTRSPQTACSRLKLAYWHLLSRVRGRRNTQTAPYDGIRSGISRRATGDAA